METKKNFSSLRLLPEEVNKLQRLSYMMLCIMLENMWLVLKKRLIRYRRKRDTSKNLVIYHLRKSNRFKQFNIVLKFLKGRV